MEMKIYIKLSVAAKKLREKTTKQVLNVNNSS